jgi:hypothetical protein
MVKSDVKSAKLMPAIAMTSNIFVGNHNRGAWAYPKQQEFTHRCSDQISYVQMLKS